MAIIKFKVSRDRCYGSYTIRELEAPDGYLLSQTVIPVEINATYQNSVEPLATVVNQAARLRYKKVDTSGEFLPGVEFSLINADTGEVVEIVTSDDAGEFVFTRFTYGNWIVRETKTLEGYNVMPDIELTVDENWVEPEPFTLVNIPNHYEFVKTDNKGNPMSGVKFTLEDGAGNILHEGSAARRIEARGGVSRRCEKNRQIRAENARKQQLLSPLATIGTAPATATT